MVGVAVAVAMAVEEEIVEERMVEQEMVEEGMVAAEPVVAGGAEIALSPVSRIVAAALSTTRNLRSDEANSSR